jgi:hypothetical protein
MLRILAREDTNEGGAVKAIIGWEAARVFGE